MAKRPGRVGQWVLPIAALFICLSALWALAAILAALLPAPAGSALGVVAFIVAAVAAVAGAATIAGIAFVLLAGYQLQVQLSERRELEHFLRRQTQLIEQFGDGMMLSDRAKAVAYREQERDALRHAIQEELARQDWEAAYHLIDEMQRSFGYRAEAARLRSEIDQRRQEAGMASLESEMGLFRELVNNCNWSAARLEAQKLAARYPDQPQTNNLLAEVDEAREVYKRRLLSEFKQAIDRSEFDRGVDLLKELDQYLTPGEAAGLQEAARGVFRGKLHNLGVQFSIAISGQNWGEALAVGEAIVEEFPNSRMAEEVRAHIDGLRKRAGKA